MTRGYDDETNKKRSTSFIIMNDQHILNAYTDAISIDERSEATWNILTSFFEFPSAVSSVSFASPSSSNLVNEFVLFYQVSVVLELPEGGVDVWQTETAT